MELSDRIKQLPTEIKRKIFYYYLDLDNEATAIRNINWKKEYKEAFYRKYINTPFLICPPNNVFGIRYYGDGKLYTYENSLTKFTIGVTCFPIFIPFYYLGFHQYTDCYSLAKYCIENGIKDFDETNKLEMIRLLMKL